MLTRHPNLTATLAVATFFAGLLGFLWLLGTHPVAALATAVAIATALIAVYIRMGARR